MDCRNFLGRHSEYVDGRLEALAEARMRRHRARCRRCARYDRVVREAGRELRSLPSIEPSADFKPRLRHRIFHIRDDDALGRPVASGTSVVVVLALALGMAALAWSPLVRESPPEVRLDPVVVTRSAPPASWALLLGRIEIAPSTGAVSPAISSPAWAVVDARPSPNALLYLYSPLAGRQRGAPLLRSVRVDE